MQGDVIGVGYRPRTGTIFFTRNGRKLEDVAHGLKTQNFFPSVGANGPCHIHVNFGQSGFVFIEANVKKWGLAPMPGSLAPPPPYGSEQGSILLEAGGHDAAAGNTLSHSPYNNAVRHGRTNSRFRPVAGGPTSPGPVRSPTDISLAQLVQVSSSEDVGEGPSSGGDVGASTADGLGFHYAPLHDRSSSLAHHDPRWAAPPPPVPSTRPQGAGSPPASSRRSPSPAAGSPTRLQRQQSPSRQLSLHSSPPAPPNQGRPGEEEAEAPPPEYESPRSTPATSAHSRGPSPDSPRPPIPSYDAAMAETRDQISEAVSEAGGDDVASAASERSRDPSPANSARNLLARSSMERE